MGVVIVRLKEAQRDDPQTFCDYRQCKLVIRQDMEVDWSPLDMLSTSILEIHVPNDVLEVKYAVPSSRGPIERGVLLQHNPQVWSFMPHVPFVMCNPILECTIQI